MKFRWNKVLKVREKKKKNWATKCLSCKPASLRCFDMATLESQYREERQMCWREDQRVILEVKQRRLAALTLPMTRSPRPAATELADETWSRLMRKPNTSRVHADRRFRKAALRTSGCQPWHPRRPTWDKGPHGGHPWEELKAGPWAWAAETRGSGLAGAARWVAQSCPTEWVGLLQLDHKESWVLKNWCFRIVVLEKTLESSLDSKEIKPVNAKGN